MASIFLQRLGGCAYINLAYILLQSIHVEQECVPKSPALQ